jgi:hypothetical protein
MALDRTRTPVATSATSLQDFTAARNELVLIMQKYKKLITPSGSMYDIATVLFAKMGFNSFSAAQQNLYALFEQYEKRFSKCSSAAELYQLHKLFLGKFSGLEKEYLSAMGYKGAVLSNNPKTTTVVSEAKEQDNSKSRTVFSSARDDVLAIVNNNKALIRVAAVKHKIASYKQLQKSILEKFKKLERSKGGFLDDPEEFLKIKNAMAFGIEQISACKSQDQLLDAMYRLQEARRLLPSGPHSANFCRNYESLCKQLENEIESFTGITSDIEDRPPSLVSDYPHLEFLAGDRPSSLTYILVALNSTVGSTPAGANTLSQPTTQASETVISDPGKLTRKQERDSFLQIPLSNIRMYLGTAVTTPHLFRTKECAEQYTKAMIDTALAQSRR